MSVNFQRDMGPEAAKMLKEIFGEPEVMDNKTALFNKLGTMPSRKMTELANAAKQLVSVEWNEIGDRKEVGGVVYELDEVGWRRLPIGTRL